MSVWLAFWMRRTFSALIFVSEWVSPTQGLWSSLTASREARTIAFRHDTWFEINVWAGRPGKGGRPPSAVWQNGYHSSVWGLVGEKSEEGESTPFPASWCKMDISPHLLLPGTGFTSLVTLSSGLWPSRPRRIPSPPEWQEPVPHNKHSRSLSLPECHRRTCSLTVPDFPRWNEHHLQLTHKEATAQQSVMTFPRSWRHQEGRGLRDEKLAQG